MAENYVLLETINLTQSAASITFDNIPQSGYTDLKIVGSVRSDYSGQAIALRINPNGSSANMSARVLLGSGSAASSFTDTIAYASAVADTSTASTYNNVEWYIPNYTSSNNKSISVDFVTETNATAAIMGLSAGLWSVSSAITSLVILTTAGNLMSGSTFSLYGVADVNTTPVTAPLATGGNIVANDGTYWYHAFLSSGTFTPQKELTCDYLVVAGGGGGGGSRGGGGGAGGYRSLTSQSLTAIAYSVTVGAGGAGGTAGGLRYSGTSSSFNSLTSSGGGGGGGGGGASLTGGSGGGGHYESVAGSAGNSGSFSPVEGYAGANAAGLTFGSVGKLPGGGGGGAGGIAPALANNQVGGNGGPGSNAHSSWLSPTSLGVSGYLAGGGGGAALDGGADAGEGGSGGGGNASTTANVVGTAGTASTGSGGGAGYGGSGGIGDASGGAGGSGVVIIRYPMSS